MSTAILSEYIESLPNICGSEDAVAQARKTLNRDSMSKMPGYAAMFGKK